MDLLREEEEELSCVSAPPRLLIPKFLQLCQFILFFGNRALRWHYMRIFAQAKISSPAKNFTLYHLES